MRRVLLFGVLLFMSGCAFRSIDSCGAEGNGSSCTPVGMNMQKASQKNLTALTGENAEDNGFLDKAVLKDEYSRVASRSDIPSALTSEQVRIRVYPYTDGNYFYDTRDVYIIVTRPGWSRGDLVYRDGGTIDLSQGGELPEIMKVNAKNLNVRTGPSTHFESIAVINTGTKVKPVDYRAGWYRIEYTKSGKTYTGWVSGRYLE